MTGAHPTAAAPPRGATGNGLVTDTHGMVRPELYAALAGASAASAPLRTKAWCPTESGSISAASSSGMSPMGCTHRRSTTICSLSPPPPPASPMNPIFVQRLYRPVVQGTHSPHTT
jgi:hypothetical protein